MLPTKHVTWSLALFTSVSYLLCVLFGLLTPEPVHMHQFLEAVLPAFTWISLDSFVLGLIESFVWGVYIGLVFCFIYNGLHRFWPSLKSPTS